MANTATLTITTPTDCDIVMTRTFRAPRNLVFEALTTPALLKQWLLGPPGWEMVICEVDLRVGGAYRYAWRRESTGKTMAMGGLFQEVVAPERLVATERFDDPWYPGVGLSTTVLEELDGVTTLSNTVRYESRATRDTVLQSGMESGVSVSYDRLEALLPRN
jgi:uncharacterized protein YndB with AHSA1/START domain